jgi:putative transposase
MGQKGYAVDERVAEVDPRVEVRSALDAMVQEGARRMLTAAIETEVDVFLEELAGVVDGRGRRQVVRNGHLPERVVLTGAGPLEVSQPRVRDRRGASHPEAVRLRNPLIVHRL